MNHLNVNGRRQSDTRALQVQPGECKQTPLQAATSYPTLLHLIDVCIFDILYVLTIYIYIYTYIYRHVGNPKAQSALYIHALCFNGVFHGVFVECLCIFMAMSRVSRFRHGNAMSL